jgi:hypothetical protein
MATTPGTRGLMDGNLTLWDTGNYISELHWRGKIRGPGFDKLTWRMVPLRTLEIVDSKGRIFPTVMAQFTTADEVVAIGAAGQLADRTSCNLDRYQHCSTARRPVVADGG